MRVPQSIAPSSPEERNPITCHCQSRGSQDYDTAPHRQGESGLPAPPPHIPRSNERTVLQKLTRTQGLTLNELYPAGRLLLNNMLAKGWIERQPDGKTYCRTLKGEQAMKLKLK